MKNDLTANIPLRFSQPIKIIGAEINDEIRVPLATFEAPLWLSVDRGAKVVGMTAGIRALILSECMTRSILLEADSVVDVAAIVADLQARIEDLAVVVTGTSKFAKLIATDFHVVANLLFIRFSFKVGDAAGHNMVTKASEALQNWILQQYPLLRYVSISGNYCTDKKNSMVNRILGRGKNVVAEVLIPRQICIDQLKTTPEKIIALNTKKNLIGSIIAGSIGSANAHFANMLLACYLATGQDAANIVEGAQGITIAEIRGEDLYFAVSLPNIIVGTRGVGKDLDFVQKNLQALGCVELRDIGGNARRLAIIIAATVLCGELSLLAAQTNPGELMRAHGLIERKR